MQEPNIFTTRNGYYIGKVLAEPDKAKRTFEVDEGDRPELMALFGRFVGESMEKDAEPYERAALLVRVTHSSDEIEQEIAHLEALAQDEKEAGRDRPHVLDTPRGPGAYRMEQVDRMKAAQLHVGQHILITDGIRIPGDAVAFRTESVIAVLAKADG